MKLCTIYAIGLVILAIAFGQVCAQDLVIYPAKGQSNEQMEKDKYDGYQLAKQQTGFAPMQQPQTFTPPPNSLISLQPLRAAQAHFFEVGSQFP